MSSRHLTFLALVAGFGLCLLPCAAQDAEVTLQFLSFPKSIDSKPVELLIGDGTTIEVEIPTNALSPTYKVKRMAAWAVGKTAPGGDGKPSFTVFGQASSLASSKQLILLVRKGGNNADGFDVIPIGNEVASFGGGNFLFMNAAKVDVAGDVGGEKFVLKPGMHVIVKPKVEISNERGLCQTSFYFRKGDVPKPFFSSTWPIHDKARGLIFFYHDPESLRLRLHTIRDFP